MIKKGKTHATKAGEKISKASVKLLQRTPLNEREIAMSFVEKVHEKFDRLVKASILFGSQAKKTAQAASDIDIILLIDDASLPWDLELIAWYREELGKIISAHNQHYQKELHITTVKLTTWWQDLLYGDPVVINILRYGEALIDVGSMFNSLKALLVQGKIKSTPEAIYAALNRAPFHLARSKVAEMSAIEGVYWTLVDAAQAALMMAGKLPPSPEHLPLMLKETFVDTGKLKIEYVVMMRDLYAIHKAIAHHEISNLKGSDIDAWQAHAEKFLSEMTRIIDELLKEKGQV